MPITKNISIRNGHLYDLDQSNSCRVTVAYLALFDGVVVSHELGQGVQESSKSCHSEPPRISLKGCFISPSIPQYIDGGIHFHCVAACGAFELSQNFTYRCKNLTPSI